MRARGKLDYYRGWNIVSWKAAIAANSRGSIEDEFIDPDFDLEDSLADDVLEDEAGNLIMDNADWFLMER